jgi:glycosyltransferase involved in cell wall biosynthesis
MRILVIPTTDWIRHPVPNRLNFIFDFLAEEHEVYVLHFKIGKFKNNVPRATKCHLVESDIISYEDPSLYYLLNLPIHFLKVREVIKDKQIDVVVSANILPSFVVNLIDVPVVFDYLDHLEESASIYYPKSFFGNIVKTGVKIITHYNLKKAVGVVTVSQKFNQFLEGIGIRNTVVIPNGVDCTALKPLPKDEAKRTLGLEGDVIGYVGSLEHWVDLETVVEALVGLKVELIVVGPGLFTDYGEKIKEMAETLGVLDKIIFIGAVPYSELGVYISSMDIGLNPLKKMDKNEYTIGGKIFNYLSCDRPVLSSRMIALVEELGDDLFYYDDVGTFRTQVETILESQPEDNKYRKVAEDFDWRLIARQYGEVLKTFI